MGSRGEGHESFHSSTSIQSDMNEVLPTSNAAKDKELSRWAAGWTLE